MRHNSLVATFGRRSSGRRALIRGLVGSLVEHGRIKTTVAKAKELRRHAERAITIGKKGTLHARRVLLSKYPNTKTVSFIFDVWAPAFKTRQGGYTRILKLGRRPGDQSEMAFIELLDYQDHVKSVSQEKATKKATSKKKAAAEGEEKPAKKTAKAKKAKAKEG